jgi:hypothetical protein
MVVNVARGICRVRVAAATVLDKISDIPARMRDFRVIGQIY